MLCPILKEKFQGWNGGSVLGNNDGTAFGIGYPDHDDVLKFVTEYLT